MRVVSLMSIVIGPLSLSLSGAALAQTCQPGEAAVCCQDPGFAGSGFPLCRTHSQTLATSAAPFSIRQALSDQHVVYWDEAPAPTYNQLYAAQRTTCGGANPPAPIPGTSSTEGFDAENWGDPGNPTRVIADGPSSELWSTVVPLGFGWTPTPAAVSNQEFPATDAAGVGFVWVDDADIYYCPFDGCAPWEVIQLTNSWDWEGYPRVHGGRVVWENWSDGGVYLAEGPWWTPVRLDDGFMPDIGDDWVAYSKWESAPDPSCSWGWHTQI